MENLNELVELAKNATPGRNYDRLESCGGGIKYQCLGDDGSLVLQCDHKNDEYGFIGPKSLDDEAFQALEHRAEEAEAKLAQRNELDEEAMHCATILEFIGSFDSDDIDGDEVDLRFEIDGEDTGCDVSITEYALRSAKAIRSILSGASISHPAPAINLAELVPEVVEDNELNQVDEYYECYQLGWNECRAAILRNIEEAK